MAETIRLFAFSCGWLQATVGFFIEGGGAEMLRSPVPSYLIDHPKGLALFDTGLGLRFRTEAGFRLAPDQQGFELDESADIAFRLRQMGIDPGDVRWLINSHLHADHCGGNASIPNATLVIQKPELDYARAQDGSSLYSVADWDHGHKVLALNGEHDLYGDGSVVLVPSYGHTPGHQCARVRLPGGDVMLTADCCYLKRSLDELKPAAHNYDQEASVNVLCKLADLRRGGTRIFYGHDGEFWKTLTEGQAIS
jgi:N-acyl homoserine lactone hydrolase